MSAQDMPVRSPKLVAPSLTFTVGFRLAMAGALWVLPAAWTVSEASEPASQVQPEQQSAKADLARRIHEVGNFQLRQLRPTRDETIHVRFELYLQLPEDGPEPALENRLDRWNERLRDQVITAVRNTETKDFTEPSLRRLQKMILLRINRLLKFTRIEQVYLTQYEFELL